METLRIVKKLAKIQSLTASEEHSTAVAFNNSKGIIGCLTDYLESELQHIDRELSNPSTLYKRDGADLYVAFKLSERANLTKLLELLTIKVKVLDATSGEE